MKAITRNLKYIAAMAVAAMIGITAANAFGQETISKDTNKAEYKVKDKGFCSNNNWSSDDRVSFNDLREMTIPATGSINVDGGQNGGIGIKGEDRGDIQIRACVQAWGKTDEAAKAAAESIKISTSGTIKAEGAGDDNHWSVSYQILVPRSTNLNLTAHNGGISISGVNGSSEFETMNGGVNLNNVSGDVKGQTTNGGVNVTLSGSSWKGSGLDVQTTNGGVHISMPGNYAAHVETGTVNGGFSSDIPSLNVEKTTDENGATASGQQRSAPTSTAAAPRSASARPTAASG